MPARQPKRNCYIIAGPNGAGKTTFATRFLPHYADCTRFVNADLIAHDLSPRAPEAAAFRAGRLMLQQIDAFTAQGASFGFETTLSGKSYVPLLHRVKSNGYALHLFFLWIPTVNMALARVADRVRLGGHAIPGPVVRRRFARGLPNLFQLYRPLLDSWILFDNSTAAPAVIASETDGKIHIANPRLFGKVSRGYKLP